MKPLIVLVSALMICTFIMMLRGKRNYFKPAGNIAMAAMLYFTSIGHFVFLSGMTEMLPNWLPARPFTVISTGLVEIGLGTGLLFERTRRTAGLLLISFFVLIVPANIYSAVNYINIETGEQTGPGPAYLWFRIPLQIFFIAWVYFFSVKSPSAMRIEKAS